jgi:lipopolysaccharide export system protein LptA
MSRRFFRNSGLAVISALLIASAPAPAPAQRGKREPIVITASHMVADKLGDTVTFSGDVTLKKEALTLTSDRIVVFYDARSKGVREIEANGSVVVRKEGRVALANRAVYYSREEKIVLTGDARIIENENQLGGDRITLFIRDDRSFVEGGKVQFYQEERREGAKGDANSK